MKCVLFLLAAIVSAPVFAQSRHWLIPPSIADMMRGPVLTPAGPNGDSQYNQKEGVIDGSGALLFTMTVEWFGIDLVDSAGQRMDYIAEVAGVDQAAIVAVPGICGRYYILYFRTSYPALGSGLVYAVFDLDQRRVVQRDLPLLTTPTLTFNAVAVGPLRRDGSRFVYAATSAGLYRLRADANGVAFETEVAAAPMIDSWVTKQLSLSADGRKAAWGFHPIYVADLDEQGNLALLRIYEIQPSGGMEFSRDAKRLFFHGYDYDTRISQIVYLDLTQSVETPPIAVTGSTDSPSAELYGFGDLQLGADGRIYIAGMNEQSFGSAYVGAIDNPESSAPSFRPHALGPFNSGDLNRLPNQLDGERQTVCTNSASCGNPALTKSTVGGGRMELVAPHPGGGLAHYWRPSDQPHMPWSGPTIFAGPAGQVDAVALMQGTWEGGNLEVIARTGDQLTQYKYLPKLDLWTGPIAYVAFGVTGTPSFIEGTHGVPFDFDLVTPLAAGGIAHYRRDSQMVWHHETTFAASAGVVSDVSLVEGEVEGEDVEVVARIDDRLVHYYLDGTAWHEGDTIATSGITGAPSLIRGRYPGALDVIAPGAQGLSYYGRFYFVFSLFLLPSSPFDFWLTGTPFGEGTVSAAAQTRNDDAIEVIGRVDGCGLALWRSDHNWYGAGMPIPNR